VSAALKSRLSAPGWWSLRVLLPAAAVAAILAVSIPSFFNSVNARERALQAQTRELAGREAARLARHAERFARSNPLDIREDIAQSTTDRALRAAAIVDEAGIVRFSHDLAWVNRRAAEVLSPEDLALVEHATRARLAITEERGIPAQRLVIAMSYQVPASRQQLRSFERGVALLGYDLSGAREQALRAAARERLPDLLVIVAGALLLVRVLQRSVAAPLDRLAAAATRLETGQFQPVTLASAPREIARLTQAFNHMGERLAEQVQELADQAEHTRTVLDNVVDGIITIDRKGLITSVNRAAERIFGRSAAEMCGSNVRMLMSAADGEAHDGHLGRYQSGGEARVIGSARELTGLRRDGTLFPMELSVSEITRHGLPMYVGMVRDISERKRNERIKDEFVSTVSHELRTPLTAIAGALGLVAGGALGETSAGAARMIEIAQRNGQRLTELIDDLLDIERLASGNMSFDMRAQPLGPVLEQSLEAMRPYGASRGIELELHDSVPQAMVRVDALRLAQVLSNLLSNAIKFSPACGVVSVRTQRTRGGVRVSVIDQGGGVPEEFRSRIFQKFAQADATDARRRGGTGLGLAISRDLLLQMGGTIGFESAVREGACFFFDLPLCTCDAGAATAPAGEREAAGRET